MLIYRDSFVYRPYLAATTYTCDYFLHSVQDGALLGFRKLVNNLLKLCLEYCRLFSRTQCISDLKDAFCSGSHDGLTNKTEASADHWAPYLESDRKSRYAAIEAPSYNDSVSW